VQATLLYTQTACPLKDRHAWALAEEAKADGVLRRIKKTPLHGKFVAWDDEEIVVTRVSEEAGRPISEADLIRGLLVLGDKTEAKALVDAVRHARFDAE
jgi:hypothetical protein